MLGMILHTRPFLVFKHVWKILNPSMIPSISAARHSMVISGTIIGGTYPPTIGRSPFLQSPMSTVSFFSRMAAFSFFGAYNAYMVPAHFERDVPQVLPWERPLGC